MILEKHELLIEARGIELRILGPLEAFQATDGLVNTSIHQQYCFVQMRLLHLNLLRRSRRKRRNPTVDGKVEAHDCESVESVNRVDTHDASQLRRRF